MAATATERVPNDIFRERYLQLKAQGFSGSEIVGWLDWKRPCGRPDTTRLERLLGLTASTSSSGSKWTQTTLRYDLAVELCDALGLEYFEAGV